MRDVVNRVDARLASCSRQTTISFAASQWALLLVRYRLNMFPKLNVIDLHACTPDFVVRRSRGCYVSHTCWSGHAKFSHAKVCGPILLAVILLFPFLFFQAQDKPTSSGSLRQIGFLMDSLKSNAGRRISTSSRDARPSWARKCSWKRPKATMNCQLQRRARKLLASGVKALVLVPHDTDKAVRIVSAAKASHVPLLC